MLASDLEDLIVRTLVRQSGVSRRTWQLALGAVRVHDPASYPHCNWSVAPTGSSREIEQIESLLDRLRLEHPIVAAG
ncbi:MAG TPA: hypothetical protein VM900_08970 [Sphingomonas sp.]|jgi:hypothetical protein|nr:hypothetical protein [Sphingomonas sp.]